MTAILPDFVIKVTENLRDAEKIRKIRQREENSVKFTATSIPLKTINNPNNLTYNSNSSEAKSSIAYACASISFAE